MIECSLVSQFSDRCKCSCFSRAMVVVCLLKNFFRYYKDLYILWLLYLYRFQGSCFIAIASMRR